MMSGLRLERILLALCLSVAAAVSIFIWKIFTFDSLDEGLLAAAAIKMLHGGVLYKDIFEFWPPGLLAILSAGFSAFGIKIEVLRALLAFFIVTATFLFFKLLRRAGFSLTVTTLATISFVVIDGSFVGLNNHWPAACGLILTALMLLNTSDSYERYKCLQTGVLAGLTALFLQYEGAIAIVGSLIVLAAAPRKQLISTYFYFGLGTLSLPTLTLAYFALHGAAEQFLYSTVVFPLTQYRGSNGATPSTLGLVQLLALLGVLVTHYQAIFRSKLRVPAIFAVILGFVNLSSGNAANVLLNSYLAHLFIIYGLSRTTLSAPSRFGSVARTVAVLLLVAPYLREIRTPLESKAAWISAASASLLTPAGELQVAPGMRDKITMIRAWLEANPSRRVMFGPYSAYHYLLFGLVNPTGYSQLTTNYNTLEQFNEAILQLYISDVDTIVFLPNESPFTVSNNHPLIQILNADFERVIALPPIGWLQRNTRLAEYEGIWLRRS